jgi:hypothetical protein
MDIASGTPIRVMAIGDGVAVRDAPEVEAGMIGDMPAGDTAVVVGVNTGDPASNENGAEDYVAWLELEAGGWVQALVPSEAETGSDGRPSSLEIAVLVTIG